MKRAVRIAVCGAGALSLAACSGAGSTFGAGGASAPPAPAPAAVAELPSGAALGGVLGGPVGAALDQADRQAAYDAQLGALEAGERRSWRGDRGAFGYVEPGPGAETAQGYCRPYAQTIYIGGRPQRGNGLACRQPDGAWRMAS